MVTDAAMSVAKSPTADAAFKSWKVEMTQRMRGLSGFR